MTGPSDGGGDLLYARFSDDEYARRDRQALDLQAGAGADALVVYGNWMARAELQYLSGWPPLWDSYLCLDATHPPALFVQLQNHVPNAREMAIVQRVEWGGVDPTATVAADLRARGAGRVGLVGAVPYQQYQKLAAALGDVALVDLTVPFRRMRLIKSAEEVEWTRRGAALCDRAIDTLMAEARPGLTEHELAGIVEASYRGLGGQTTICFLTTGPMAGGGRIVPAQHPSARRLRSGDAITIELSAGFGGYTGQVLRTIAVDGEPPPAFRRVHDVAEQAFEAIVQAIRPGARAADLLEAARLIDDAGLTVCDDVVHGYGGGYLAPVLRTPATQHAPPQDLELRPGMFLVVQPNVVDDAAGIGVQTGELFLVADDGASSFHCTPRGLLRTVP